MSRNVAAIWSIVPKRILLAILSTVLVTALVIGAVTYASARNPVTVAIDGKEQTLTTYGDTVADVLEAQGVEVGPRDAVAPDLESPIDEGSRIAVSYGRQLTLKVDGRKQTYWTTARQVDDALSQLGQRFLAGSELSTSRSAYLGRDGLTLVVRTPKDVKLIVGARKPIQMTTTGLTVGEALLDRGVELNKYDEITPRLGAKLDGRNEIVVTRVHKAKSQAIRAVPYDTVEREDGDLYTGQHQVAREGTTGAQRLTYKVVHVNGKLVRKFVIARKLVRSAGGGDPSERHEGTPVPRSRASACPRCCSRSRASACSRSRASACPAPEPVPAPVPEPRPEPVPRTSRASACSCSRACP